MSQMKPYCFKCGAELDPDAIYCPDCGRLQRSMVVRTPGSPQAPPQGRQLYPNQPEHPDLSQQDTETAEPLPGQPEPDDDGWYPVGGGDQAVQPDPAVQDRVYAQRPYPEQPYGDQPYPAQEYPEQPDTTGEDAYPSPTESLDDAYSHSGYSEPGYQEPEYHEPSLPEQAYPEPSYPTYADPAYPEHGYDHPNPAQDYTNAARTPAPFGHPGGHDPTYGTMPDPYGLEEWRPPPSRRTPWLRLVVIAGAGLLGLLVVGYAIGNLVGGALGPATPAPAAQPSAQAATPTPASQLSAQPSASATPGLGTGSATFKTLSSDIPANCTTRQGCPVVVSLKNNGGRGGGTVVVTLADDNQKDIATFTGQVPVTEPGATVQVTGYATGPGLNAYLVAGGLVHISKVAVTST